MKKFNESFKTALNNTIQDIENQSVVEIITIIEPQSNPYKDISLWAAFLLMSGLYTFFMFAPAEFNVYLIYFFTVLSFPAMFLFFEIVPKLKRPFLQKEQTRKKVEIMARAIFQKIGMHHTEQKIGVLVYVSVLEKQVKIIADRGAEVSVPQEVWSEIQTKLDAIFTKPNPAEALLTSLTEIKPYFSEYLPPIENDINELPDNPKVEF